MKYNVTLLIEAKDQTQVSNIANGLQKALVKVRANDLEKMLNLLAKNPQWIKMATKFV